MQQGYDLFDNPLMRQNYIMARKASEVWMLQLLPILRNPEPSSQSTAEDALAVSSSRCGPEL